ncbi:MAG: peptidoglycan DD-metalloendopeptidase family protein [Campylobacterales bacterium]|nr:peptidoglycan DD-metalloendopeptidase family protein [Campylobacterales bacterium]
MRLLLPIFWMFVSLWAHQVEFARWDKGETFLTFLERNKLPLSIYYDLDKEDQTLTEEIITGVNYQILRNEDGNVSQALIPINDELQLHLTCNEGSCSVAPIPIESQTRREAFMLTIESSPYYDIEKATGSKALAQIFVGGFKNSLNFRRDLRKGDRLVMIYEQKYRFGKPFSMPRLHAAMIEMRGKRYGIYRHEDERYYDHNGAQIEGFLLALPVRNARISSPFSKRRFHPVLKRYRAHLGVDYAARSGTPIMAAGNGKVVFAGYNRGYGNVIKINHEGNYMTLYAHMSSFKKGIKNGMRVKQGQVIGYVGSTGISTGPHLHFGLYKNNEAINPQSVVQVATSALSGKRRSAFMQIKQRFDAEIDTHLQAQTAPSRLDDVQSIYYIPDEQGSQKGES